ncbi:MAG TPA: HAMP domain-containing sensor histidine kinase [Acidimicrobiia bacterium]|nr:HAMP domain-containing sensor histidine kinase [Acidimicrobiia bacterium]
MSVVFSAAAPDGKPPSPGRTASKNGLSLGIRPALIAAVLVSVTAGALFGAVQVSRNVARASVELHYADEAARAATVVRSHIALAALGSEDQQQLSGQEAATALGVLDASLASLEGSPAAADSLVAGLLFANAARDAVDSIGTAAVDQETADLWFREMMDSLDELRLNLVAYVDRLNSSYNTLGIVLGVATVGLAPLVLVVWTRSMARKSMEVRELSLQLKHEGELRDAHNSVLRTVVHEFRTPLTGISGLAAVLEDPSLRASAEAAEMIGMIRTEAEDMSQLTDDILASAGLETGQLEIRVEPIDVTEVADRALAMFHRRGIEIDVSLDPAAVVADEFRLRQILKNLVSNAVKYGGPRITVTGTETLDSYELVVADDGDGVPDVIVEQLFDPFPHGGKGAPSQSVGLGLFIVRELSEAMGGSVSHERVEDITMFTVRLPLVEAESAKIIPLPTMSVGA